MNTIKVVIIILLIYIIYKLHKISGERLSLDDAGYAGAGLDRAVWTSGANVRSAGVRFSSTTQGATTDTLRLPTNLNIPGYYPNAGLLNAE